MDIVINLLLLYSKTLAVLLMFQQVSNQPLNLCGVLLVHFCMFYSSSYVLLLGTLLSFLSLSLITYIRISMVVKHLIFFMACTPLLSIAY